MNEAELPGDKVLEVAQDPDNETGLIVIFESGYRLVCDGMTEPRWPWSANNDQISLEEAYED